MVREFPMYNGQQYNLSSAGSTGGLQGGTSAFMEAGKADGFVGFKSYVPGASICKKIQHFHPFGLIYGENPLDYPFPLILLEISSIIIVTRLVRFLLKPLRQPKIVSEIIGGIIVGPSVLGRSKKLKAFLFPDNSDFMVKNIGLLGFMFYLFLAGVQMDMTLITQSGKKHICIVLASVLVPMLIIFGVGFSLRDSMDAELATIPSIVTVAATVAVTSFPVLHDVLKELNLVSSEVGRMSLSISIIANVMGIGGVFAFEYSRQKEAYSKNEATVWYMLATSTFLFILLILVRKLIFFCFDRKDNKPRIDQPIIVAILISAFAMGFLTDLFGLAIGNGPWWFGLIIPDGPPLGSLIVERTETIATHILMPFSYALIGMYVDISNLSSIWPSVKPLVAMIITGYVTKILATYLACLYFKIPWRHSLAISLSDSVRGQVELLLFIHWMEKGMLQPSYVTIPVLLTTLTTGIVAPLIPLIYDPTKQYMVKQRRTMQHTAPGTDLRILLAIHDQESVPGLITLLKASNPTPATPVSVIALCVMELIGRFSPVSIDHDCQPNVPPQYASCLAIHNAFNQFQKSHADCIKLYSYTIVALKTTLYQDICERALINQATLIILPFNRDNFDINGGGGWQLGVRSVNSLMLSTAPCSVGIFVEKRHAIGPNTMGGSRNLHFAMLFLGGADAREALTYADRMVGNPNICLTVIRFLAFNGEGDDKMEKRQDDGVVTWFWVKNQSNERVLYNEVIVRNGAETMAAIRAFNERRFDLWIVGRKQGINPLLLQGLPMWTDNHQELGIIGNYVGAVDFDGSASVLVIQQHVLGEHGKAAKLATKRLK